MATTFVSRRIVAAAAGSILAAAIFAGAQQQQLAGKTAEQAFKNIQVLKEIPAEQVVPTMRVMAGSLGVNCGFCHVEDRSKDDLMTKQTARKMITMMMNINKDNFDARQEVTCFTCHKGTNDPVSVLQYSDEPEAPRPGGRGGQGPSADQILANYVQALGGEQAIRKVSSVTVMETRDAPAPQGGAPRLEAQEGVARLPLLLKDEAVPPAGVAARAADAAVLLRARHRTKSSSI